MIKKSKSYLLNDKKVLSIEKNRLSKQAKILFNLESKTIEKHLSKAKKTILELGCGNGSYLYLLSTKYKYRTCVGVDRNKNLLNQIDNLSKNTIIHKKLDITDEKSLKKIFKVYDPDTIVIRYVAQHLSNQELKLFLNILYTFRRTGRRFVFIDSDNTLIRFRPSLWQIDKLIEKRIRTRRSKGGDCTVGSKLYNYLKENGFKKIKSNIVKVKLRDIGYENWKDIFKILLESSVASNLNKYNRGLIDALDIWTEKTKKFKTYNSIWPINIVSGE